MLENVVLVHGLWMVGVDMTLLRRRIRHAGFEVHQFSCSTIRNTPAENAISLQQYLQHQVTGEVVHFVAHSLGGLVLRHLFHQFPEQLPGRVVTLGTPHSGSQVARQLVRHAWGRSILGKSVEQGLIGEVPEWHTKNPLGVIAGNHAFGAGRFICRFEGENDGTIAVAETRLTGMADHIILPASHTGLIYNRAVARQICIFIKQGYFTHTK
jgi:pimeloyl-ACP methyl ester carboxylesterase